MTLTLPPLHHIGLVVASFDRAADDFRRRWGVQTDDVMELDHADAVYRGTPTSVAARYGFIRTGASEIELIEPLSSPSPYADFLEHNGDGIHHLAYVVDAVDPFLGQLADSERPPVIELDAPLAGGGRFVYVAGAAHGPSVELIEVTEQMRRQMPGPGGLADGA